MVLLGIFPFFVFVDGKLNKERTFEDGFGSIRTTHSARLRNGVEGWTDWPKFCDYDNEVSVRCLNEKINPNATIELWDDDEDRDYLLKIFKWNLVKVGGQIDAHFHPQFTYRDYARKQYTNDDFVELFWMFRNPCNDGKDYRRGDLLTERILFY
uniref:Uncharacterized protein n=1 Tax=Panagrolaimus sp. JU765 TaxID=591449 RepID=A0AC34RGU9_9BILA